MIQNESLYNLSSILVLFGWKNLSYGLVGPMLGANIALLNWGLEPYKARFNALNNRFLVSKLC
jgi:hypothetical protein